MPDSTAGGRVRCSAPDGSGLDLGAATAAPGARAARGSLGGQRSDAAFAEAAALRPRGLCPARACAIARGARRGAVGERRDQRAIRVQDLSPKSRRRHARRARRQAARGGARHDARGDNVGLGPSPRAFLFGSRRDGHPRRRGRGGATFSRCSEETQRVPRGRGAGRDHRCGAPWAVGRRVIKALQKTTKKQPV